MTKIANLSVADERVINNLKPYKQKKILRKIKKGYPPQYAIGHVDFWHAKILVNKNVLIPRFETELMVSKIVEHFKNRKEPIIGIDMGTGSGCIAIALAQNLYAQMEAIDISNKALRTARKNAKINKVNIKFKRANILKIKTLKQYDLIVSNPPYIGETDEVDPIVKYEPQKALYAFKDDLKFYKKIMQLAIGKINAGGLMAFEINANRGQQLLQLAQSSFPNQKAEIMQDYTGQDRYLFIFGFK